MKVTLLENINSSAIEVFSKNNIQDVTILKGSIEDAPSDVFESNIIGIRSRSKLTLEFLKKFKNLSAIGCFCIGTDQVNLKAAKTLGIPVFNAPYSNTRSVAELVIAEIITLYRKLHVVNLQMHQGVWSKSAIGCNEIKNKTLGIIGYGSIGSQVGVLAEFLGMQVIYHDIDNKMPFGSNTQAASLEELLEVSDVVSLHVPQDEMTKKIMNKDTISKMKAGSYIINNSRGHVVDINDLADALESGHIAGAAIDVFPSEPSNNNEEFISPLRKFDNVLLTPHIGGSTEEAQKNIAIEVATKLASYVSNASTAMSVNYPNLSLSPIKESSIRIAHSHQNIPGMLQSINSEITKRNLNIQSQILSTDNDIGYVVLDIETCNEIDDLEEALKLIPGTIKVIVLKP